MYKFCSTENTRPYLKNPFHHKGHIYATDGKIIIRTPGGDINDVSPLNPERIWDGNYKPLCHASTSKIAAIVATMPTYSMIEMGCPNCGGKGRAQCSQCDSEIECPDCGGTGKTKEQCDGADFVTKDAVLKIGGNHIAGQYARLICETFPDSIVSISQLDKQLKFAIAEYEIIVMLIRIELITMPRIFELEVDDGRL